MDAIVFGNFTVQDLIIAAVVIFILSVCWKIAKKLFKNEKSAAYAVFVKCYNCGWEGKVSKYARKCPKCSSGV